MRLAQVSKSCQLPRDQMDSTSSLLGGFLALLALLLGALDGGSLLLDTVKLFDHESSGDSICHEQ